MGAVAVYDFTLSQKYCLSHSNVISKLREISKKWAFQLEQGEEGYVHYQGRFSLYKKTTFANCAKLFLPHARLSQTSSESSKDVFGYVTKVQTRIGGPWTSDDPEPFYLPLQFQVQDFYPWQIDILNDRFVSNRQVVVVIDKKGCTGKTTVGMNLAAQEKGFMVPPLDDYKDLMAVVMAKMQHTKSHKIIVIDIPRAIKQEKMYPLFAAVESIKNGYVFDTRYKYKEHSFDAPTVVVFMNTEPPERYLSSDRWKLLKISLKKEFIPF